MVAQKIQEKVDSEKLFCKINANELHIGADFRLSVITLAGINIFSIHYFFAEGKKDKRDG